MPWGSCRQTWRREGCPPLPHHLVCAEKFTSPYLTDSANSFYDDAFCEEAGICEGDGF